MGYGDVIEERDNTAQYNLITRYDYGDDIIRLDRSSGVYYYISDGLGSTRQLVDSTGAVQDSDTYDAFGNLAASSGTVPNWFLFNEQQLDPTGLYNLRARYMDPTRGEFLGQDPYSGRTDEPQTLHRYLYVRDDPTNWTDRSGRDGDLASLGVAEADSELFDALDLSVDAEARQFVADITATLGEGVPWTDLTATERGQFFNWIGKMAEQYLSDALETILPDDAEVVDNPRLTTSTGNKTFLDRFISYEGKNLYIEAKYALPRSGDALARTVTQITTAASQNGGRTVLWSLVEPSPAQEATLQRAVAAASPGLEVDFASGVQGIVNYVSTFFGL